MKSSVARYSRVLLLVLMCLAGSAAFAQYRASIRGTVTDPQGAIVSGATVTLTNKETNQSSTTTSDGSGIYNFNGLPPSKFSLTVEKTGFKKKVLDNVVVISEQSNSANVELDLGQVTESVTVNADDAPLLNTESANLGGSIRAADIQKLPSIGRDAFQLLQLAPGAFGDGAQSAGGGTANLPGTTIGGTGSTDGVFKIENGGQITANGARTGENNYQIDGVGTTSVTWGGTSVITPNEDSIKEVRVITDNYDAENGRYRGAQVQIISQNGTNDIHGSLFFKGHRPGLNAFQKYNGLSGVTRDAARFNDWGGTVGGPIWKNKIFGFFSYETLSNKSHGTDGSGWYETDAFRALATSGTNASAFYGFPGVGPFGGQQTDTNAGNTLDCAFVGLREGTDCHYIPGGGLNLGSPLTGELGSRDLAYNFCLETDGEGNCVYNTPGTGGNGNPNNLGANLTDVPTIAFFNGIRTISDSNHRQYNGRLDFNATNKDLIAFSIYYVPNTSTSLNGNGLRQMNTFNSNYKNRAMTLLWNHTFGATMANEARINAAGWQNKDLADNPSAPWGLPSVGFNAARGVTPNGYGIGSFNGFDQWTYAGKDVLTKVHGAHTMKMGGEFTRLLSVDAPFWADRPGYQFNNVWDFLNDAPISENVQSDPQTGVPSALRKDLRSNVIGLFFQDNYKLRSNLTVTAGLRWEYFGPITEKQDKLASVVFGQGANRFTDLRLRTGGGQFNAQKTNFGPQLGFAWSPNGVMGHDFSNRLVIRGGIGIAFNGVAQSNTLDVRFNPPFVSNQPTLTGSDIQYIGSFPTNIHDPNGYASNPATILTFGTDNLPVTGTVGDLTALAATQPTTYSYHYTMGGEYDLGHRWVASVGYQGSLTRHLTQHYNLYNIGSALGLELNPKVHGITYYGNDGSGRFNALLLELKHSIGNSFMLDTQYRLSENKDSGSNAYAGGFYQWNMATNYARSDFDSRHAFKIFGVWSPTIFKGQNNLLEKVVGGWSISGILNAHTGFPWTPFYNSNDLTGGFDPVFFLDPNGFGGGSSSSAGSGQVLPGSSVGGFNPNYRDDKAHAGLGSQFFTPPAIVPGVLFDCLFANPDPVRCPDGQLAPGPIPGAPGVRRNAFTGPGYFDIDATLSKSFGLPKLPILGENAKLEIRASFFNLFNKVNLTSVQTNVLDDHFGEAQNALGSRVIEMQARFNF
ncbi:MAG: carboxypeptidase regulatory-like domain-containing protein [Acidobacteria bacterium]|nr:carboxypeptidase regulatory-like domain-containing protein [Acidobacteriota bacterium]